MATTGSEEPKGRNRPRAASGGELGIADYVYKAADGIDRCNELLRKPEIDAAIRAVQDLARRQPALFVSLAFGAGFLTARVLKSSQADSRMPNGGDAGGRAVGVSDFGAAQFGTTSGDIPRVSSEVRTEGEVL